MSLRHRIERDLAVTLEGEFGLPVVLISPNGIEQELVGQVLYDTMRIDPDTGATIVINQPVVTLRRSSLIRIPISGERWAVKIPATPLEGAALETYFLEQPTEDGRSMGFIRLYLTKVVQSV
jgi:hypothetical protein